MPGQHAPERGRIQALRKNISTGRMPAAPGRVGRELSKEELQDCRERLAVLEEEREQGIEQRRHATAEADRVIQSVEAVATTNADEVRRSTAAAVVQHVDGRFDGLAWRPAGSIPRQPGSSQDGERELRRCSPKRRPTGSSRCNAAPPRSCRSASTMTASAPPRC